MTFALEGLGVGGDVAPAAGAPVDSELVGAAWAMRTSTVALSAISVIVVASGRATVGWASVLPCDSCNIVWVTIEIDSCCCTLAVFELIGDEPDDSLCMANDTSDWAEVGHVV